MIREDERRAFEAFQRCHPALFRDHTCSEGADPPDFICTNAQGERIGIELAEWVDEAAIKVSKRAHRIRGSFRDAIAAVALRPANIGRVWIFPRRELHSAIAKVLGNELRECIEAADRDWESLTARWPVYQGYPLSDFASYPTLAKYVSALDLAPTQSDIPFHISFLPQGGAYSTRSGFQALLRVLGKKESMYGDLRQKQSLAKLHLVLYWWQGALHNAPYDNGMGYSLNEVAADLQTLIETGGTNFDAVFICDVPREKMVRVWPA
jgi:hypothetical protein